MSKNNADGLHSRKPVHAEEHEYDEEEQNLKLVQREAPQKPNQILSAKITSYMATFFLSMVILDVTQEAIMRAFPGVSSISSAVTLFQFGYCFFLPVVITRGKVFKTFPRTLHDALPYFKLSSLVFCGTFFANTAVRYVTYPTKIVFKSAKLIPTMIVSTVLYKGSKYRAIDYLAAILLCSGAAGFTYASKTKEAKNQNDSYFGVLILCVSVTCDALIPNIQKKMMSPSEKKSNVNEEIKGSAGLSAPAVMVNVNAIGFGGVFLLMVVNGSLMETVHVASKQPGLLVYLNIIGLGLGTAVLAYTKLIKASSSVTAVMVSTLRKVATMSLSYVIFPKPLHRMQVFSGLLVLSGVLINSFCKKKK